MAVKPLIFTFDNVAGMTGDTVSGAPGSLTAINGTAASYTGSVVTLDGSPDLSGFDANTWGLFLKTDSGRRFFDLSAADNVLKTVTTQDAPAGTATGLSWAIGGKLKNLTDTNAVTLLSTAADAKYGWTIHAVGSATAYMFTGTQTIHPANSTGTESTPFVLLGDVDGSGLPTTIITTATDNINLFNITGSGGSGPQSFVFRNLKLTNTATNRGTGTFGDGSNGRGIFSSGGGVSNVFLENVIADGLRNVVDGSNRTGFTIQTVVVSGCELKNSLGCAVCCENHIELTSANFLNNAYDVSNCNAPYSIVAADCVFNGATINAWLPGDAAVSSNGTLDFKTCTFRNISASALKTTVTQWCPRLNAEDCIFESNGAGGAGNGVEIGLLDAHSGFIRLRHCDDFNNHDGLTNANATSVLLQTGGITYTSTAFNSSTDSGLNSTAGGGAAIKGTATVAPGSTTNTPGDPGAIPSGGGGAAAGGGLHPLQGQLAIR